MNIIPFLKQLSRGLWKKELEDLDDYRANDELYKKTIKYNQELKDDIASLENENIALEKDISLATSETENYKRLFIDAPKPSYKGWYVFESQHATADGLKVPPNTFVTINDRKIRSKLIELGFHKLEFEDLIYKLELWCYNYVKYQYDNNLWGNMEQWTSASHVFQKRVSDCEDHAILFQACMHMLGYGDKSVVMVNVCKFGESFQGGHAYNKVLLNNKWIVIDPTNPSKYRKDDWVYDIIHPQLNWFFNYWGVYQLKNDEVLE